jgi:hypothetical protein
VKAYILIQAEPGTDGQLARDVGELAGVRRVERVTGPYDLIAEADDAGIHALVPRIQELDGVLRALTSLVLAEREPNGSVTLDEPEVAASGA